MNSWRRYDAIYAVVMEIPAGRVATYGQVADLAGMARHARQVGQALRRLPEDSAEHVYHQFTIRAPRRDALRGALAAAGVASEIYYPHPLHLQECFADLGYRVGSLPNAEAAAAESLSLPIHPHLSADDQDYVVAQLAAFYQ